MLKQTLASFTPNNDSADAGRAKSGHPRPSTSRVVSDSSQDVSMYAPEEIRDRKPHLNGQSAFSVTPGPTKQPYYPAIRFVEHGTDGNMAQAPMPPRTNSIPPPKRPSPPSPVEQNGHMRQPPKTRIDTNVQPRHQQERPANLIPSTALNYQYDIGLRSQSSHSHASVSSPSVPERRPTLETPTLHPSGPIPPRRHSEQQGPPTPSTQPSSEMPAPFIVDSRTSIPIPLDFQKTITAAITPVQMLFEQAWNSNVHMVHEQLAHVYAETMKLNSSAVVHLEGNNDRLRRERDEARAYANKIHAELDELKQHARNLEAEILRFRQRQLQKAAPPPPPPVKREEPPPTPNSAHPDMHNQTIRTIRLSPSDDARPPHKMTYAHPSASPRMQHAPANHRPSSSHSTNSPPISRPPVQTRYSGGELSRQDSSSRRMDYYEHSPPHRAPIMQKPPPPRHNSDADRPMGRLSPSNTPPTQPRLQPHATQHSLPRFATLDLPALQTTSSPAPQPPQLESAPRPFKRSRAAYESEEHHRQAEGGPSLSSKMTKTSHGDTPQSRSREHSAPPPSVKDEPSEIEQLPSTASSDKEQCPPPPRPPTASPPLPVVEPPNPPPATPSLSPTNSFVRIQPKPLGPSSAPNSNPAKPEPPPAPPEKKGLGIKHLNLLYEQRGQEYLCRMCPQVRMRFPLTTPWSELVKHCEDQHASACQEMERLGTGSLAEMAVRQRKMGLAAASGSAKK